MNATQKAYNMADSVTNKRLSSVLMTTLIPELAQDFAIFVEDSGKNSFDHYIAAHNQIYLFYILERLLEAIMYNNFLCF